MHSRVRQGPKDRHDYYICQVCAGGLEFYLRLLTRHTRQSLDDETPRQMAAYLGLDVNQLVRQNKLNNEVWFY